jgi:hypothetical protein
MDDDGLGVGSLESLRARNRTRAAGGCPGR